MVTGQGRAEEAPIRATPNPSLLTHDHEHGGAAAPASMHG